jgi:adenylate kinase family enzyme
MTESSKLHTKIMIIGRPGSGKSTFAICLANILNIRVFHLDKYFFEKNWIERDYQEFLSSQEDMISRASWIIDGNSTKSYEMRYACADLCLYFNFRIVSATMRNCIHSPAL